MKKLSIFIYIALICIVTNSAFGRKIRSDEAIKICNEFLAKKGLKKQKSFHQGSAEVSLIGAEVYVINNSMGGWVLVSADDCKKNMVLGYSTTGKFNYESLSPSARLVIEGYSREISSLKSNNGENFSSGSNELIELDSPSSVEPLLGETCWGQTDPYNLMCPMLDGRRTVTGCVNTAIAQIMYYYKYPARGKGEISYDWNGTELSMNFGESEYQWDKMLPIYGGEESEEARMAVAKLMYDCGVANTSDYAMSTGTALNVRGLVNFFGYDKSVYVVKRSECTLAEYEGQLRKEISEGRPVYYEGGGENGAHAFVCDGYDNEGYFHFNFGWDGNGNGYYLTWTTGYDTYPTIFCSIQPDKGGTPGLWVGTANDFCWEADNTIKCEINGSIPSNQFSNIEIGIALCDENGSPIKYYIEQEFPNSVIFGISEFRFDEDVEDGNYILFPVYRLDEGEWKKVSFGDNYCNHVNLSVENGVKTFSNPGFGEKDSDVVEVEGYYYRIADSEAKFTRRNNRGNCYSGSVTIPDSIEYEGETYPVREIDYSAFEDCKLDKLSIGSNINIIRLGSFSGAQIGEIEFAGQYNLRILEGWSFNGTDIKEVILPLGVQQLGMCCFQSCKMESIVLPRSLSYVESSAFNDCKELRDITVLWDNSKDLPQFVQDPFTACDIDEITLHVLPMTSEIYKNDPVWGMFKNIVEDVNVDEFIFEVPTDPDVVEYEGLYYRIGGGSAVLTRRNILHSYSGDLIIPESILCDETSYPVESIDEKLFEGSNLGRVVIGGNMKALSFQAFSRATIDEIVFSEAGNLKELGILAFERCEIKDVKLPYGLNTLDTYAFLTSNIQTVTIPSSVTRVDYNSFYKCNNLKDIYVGWKDEASLPDCNEYAFESCNMDDINLHVPAGTGSIYRHAPIWKEFANITEDSKEDIPTEVRDIYAEGIKIDGSRIYFEGISSEDNLEVFNIDGQTVGRYTTGSVINPGKGFYILKVGGKVFKILL